MFEKLIDKYNAKKLEQKIKNSLCIFRYDLKFIYTKNYLKLYIKPKYYKEEFSKMPMMISYSECYFALLHYGEFIKEIKDTIKDYKF